MKDATEKTIKRWLNLLPYKLAYFLLAGSKYTLVFFLGLFLKDAGMNYQQTGLIVGTRYTFEVVGAIASNYLADSYRRPHLVLGICVGVSSLFTSTLPWVAKYRPENTFYYMLASASMSSLFEGGILPTVDAQVMQMSKQYSEELYVRQRMWLSVGLGVIPFSCGVIHHRLSETFANVNFVMFYMLMALNVMLFICSFPLFRTSLSKKTFGRVHQENRSSTEEAAPLQENATLQKTFTTKHGLKSALKQLDLLVVYYSALVVGSGLVFQYSFVFLFLQSELNLSRTICGLSALVQSLAEVAGAPLGLRVARISGSHYFAVALGMCGMGLTFVLYFFLNHVAMVLALSFTMGVGYALFIFPAIDMLYKLSDAHCRGTVYAINSALINGVGGCIAGYFGGYIIEMAGGRMAFLGGAVILLVSAILIAAYAVYSIRKSSGKHVIAHL